MTFVISVTERNKIKNNIYPETTFYYEEVFEVAYKFYKEMQKDTEEWERQNVTLGVLIDEWDSDFDKPI
jgi:hypothetical protein